MDLYSRAHPMTFILFLKSSTMGSPDAWLRSKDWSPTLQTAVLLRKNDRKPNEEDIVKIQFRIEFLLTNLGFSMRCH